MQRKTQINEVPMGEPRQIRYKLIHQLATR
jgi:hypothetical protein